MSNKSQRSLLYSSAVWAGMALLALLVVGFWVQGPQGPSIDAAQTYQRFRDGGWMAPLTLDQSPVVELSLPYCGWPPLYMCGLCLLSLTGLPFWPAALLYNAMLTVLAALVAVRIARRCGSTWPPGLVFFLAVACPAYGLQFRFAYPVMMIPLCCLVPVNAALAVHAGGLNRRRWLALAVGAGLLASLGTWVSYMAAPALFLAFGLTARRHRGQQEGDAALRVVRWSLALGLVMVVGFAIFKLASGYALRHEPMISSEISGGLSKFLERMMPGRSVLLATVFYSIVRMGWVLLPTVILALLLVRRGGAAARDQCRALPAVPGTLILIPLLFACFLPGEIGPSEHNFHAMDYVPLALLLPALWVPFRAGATMKAVAVWGISLLAYFQGYRILPDLALENPRAEAAERLFDAPGNYHYGLKPASASIRSLMRTTFKNGFNIPATDPRAGRLDPKAARWQEWLTHGQLYREAVKDRRVLLAWTPDGFGVSFFTGRPLLGVQDFAGFQSQAAGLAKIGLLFRSGVIVPEETDTSSVLAVLAGFQATAVERPVAGTGYKLLSVGPSGP